MKQIVIKHKQQMEDQPMALGPRLVALMASQLCKTEHHFIHNDGGEAQSPEMMHSVASSLLWRWVKETHTYRYFWSGKNTSPSITPVKLIILSWCFKSLRRPVGVSEGGLWMRRYTLNVDGVFPWAGWWIKGETRLTQQCSTGINPSLIPGRP